MALKPKYAPAKLASETIGNNCAATKQASHSANTETDIAAPRMRFGKISERITHVIGASVEQ